MGAEHTIIAEHLSGHDLLVEVGLTLLDSRGETLLLGLVNAVLDGISLTFR